MYELFLSGAGAPANPPGCSSHELGVSVDLATPAMRDIVDQIGWQYGWGKIEAPAEWWHVSWGGCSASASGPSRSSGSGASPPSMRTTSALHGFVRSVGA